MSSDKGEEGKYLEPKTNEIEIQNNKKKRKKEKKEKKKEQKKEDEIQPPETPATIIRLKKLGINTVYYDRGNELANRNENSINESQTSSEDDNLTRETPRKAANGSRPNQRQMESNGRHTALEQGSGETVPKDSEEEDDRKLSDESNSKEDEEVKEEEEEEEEEDISADKKVSSDNNAKSDLKNGSAGKEQVYRKARPPSVSSSSSSESNNDTGSSDDDDDDDDDDDATFHSNGGYFDIYLEELFGKILRQRGGAGKTMEDHRPVYHRDGAVKFSSKSRKGRRGDREKRKHVDTVAYEEPDFHQILPATRSPSRSNLRSHGRPLSSSSGKVVRFVEEDPRAEAETVNEQLWLDKVQALGQLNHKRLARVPRRGVDGKRNRSDRSYYNRQRNSNYTDIFSRHYFLPPVRRYAAAAASQDRGYRVAGKSGFVPKTNSMGENWVSSLRSGNFGNDVRRVEWMEDLEERPGIIRPQFDDGSDPYNRQSRTGWRSILGSQKNPDALQEKKERNAMRFEYGRFMREVNRIRTSQ